VGRSRCETLHLIEEDPVEGQGGRRRSKIWLVLAKGGKSGGRYGSRCRAEGNRERVDAASRAVSTGAEGERANGSRRGAGGCWQAGEEERAESTHQI
jgi:hypothetical protein